MNLAITGSNGFIGGDFISSFSGHYDNIVRLQSSGNTVPNYSLSSLKTIVDLTKDVDAFIHFAFDHTYTDNIIGIKNILEACKQNQIKRLYVLSSMSVYDIRDGCSLSLSSPYTKSYDPYAREKIKIELILKKHSLQHDSPSIYILRPTIVYGGNGAWDNYFNFAASFNELHLPRSGAALCNVVPVASISKFIHGSLFAEETSDWNEHLLSGHNVTWREMYKSYFQKNRKEPEIMPLNSKRQYHNNVAINFILYLWFSTILGFVFNNFVSLAKSIWKKKMQVNSETTKEKEIFYPTSITRFLHFNSFVVKKNNGLDNE